MIGQYTVVCGDESITISFKLNSIQIKSGEFKLIISIIIIIVSIPYRIRNTKSMIDVLMSHVGEFISYLIWRNIWNPLAILIKFQNVEWTTIYGMGRITIDPNISNYFAWNLKSQLQSL